MKIKPMLVTVYWKTVHVLQTVFGIIETKKKIPSKSVKKAYLIGTPEHDNLGDHAIALAEIQFLNKYFSSYEQVEISVESWREYAILLKMKTGPEDIFFLTGGGNMGNVYFEDEKVRRYIVSHYPANRIFVFPQTVYFTDDFNGQRELALSAHIYNHHSHLLLCAREEDSFKFMQKNFDKCKVFLCPDMVFSLRLNFEKREKNGTIGLCIRHDNESTLSADHEEKINNALSKKYMLEAFSTCCSGAISAIDREKYIAEILSKISEFSFVITNRLHAMIFSVLAGTTCLVYPTQSPKISSTLKWLKEYPSIQLISNDATNIENQINMIYNKEISFPIDEIYYTELANQIKNINV